MMNEEITAEIARLIPTLSPFIREDVQLAPIKDLLDTFARLIALKAYEHAAQARCYLCRQGHELARNPLANCKHYHPRGLRRKDAHRGTIDYLDAACYAAEIHALKDQLVLEPASV